MNAHITQQSKHRLQKYVDFEEQFMINSGWEIVVIKAFKGGSR